MKQVFDQLLHFLQEGIAAIFRFVELIWNWTIDQISKVTQVPWQSWPLWKQVAIVLVGAAVLYVLFKAGKELWEAGEKILAAFATLLAVLVRTLPLILLAGLIAAGGLYVINSLNF
jgi:hypothetical protein